LALEETTLVALITSVEVLISLAVAYLLLPELGILGAAASRALVIGLDAILSFYVLSRKVTLELDLSMIEKTFLSGSIMAVVVWAVQLVHYSEFMLPLYVLIGAGVYLTMLRLLKAVEDSDLDLLQRFLGKRLTPLSSILKMILLPSHTNRVEH